MSERLNVFLGGTPVGTLDWNASLDVFSFRYLPAYLGGHGAIALSMSLPLREEAFGALESRTFFENLLPPVVVRRKLEKILHHDYRNTFAFLRDLGGDCAGAISLCPDGMTPDGGEETLRELTEDEADGILRALPERPLLQGLVEGYRISVAGAQDKLVARIRENTVILPLRGAASTHIVKPQMSICTNSVENECFCQRLAHALGLDAAKAGIIDIRKQAYYVSERYDRETSGGRVTRLLQEDFCQAMGVPAEEKYEEDGGPSAVRCFSFLRKGGFGFAEMQKFVDALVFNFLIGNADAHAKNYSLLYRGGLPSMAPLYDILSTAVYLDLAGSMAMSIGGAMVFDDVTIASFDAFALKCDINPKFIRGRIERIVQAMPSAMKAIADELSDTGHPSGIYDGIAAQVVRRIDQLK